ncbi:MAG: DUF3237 domain-containing protein [Anaerolineales bacterium]|nr:DUF3237 domain-containing protein [Anaerolineales bacterium]
MKKTCLKFFALPLFFLLARNPLAEDRLPKPELEFLFEMTATLEPPQELGRTQYGTRRIINISGGTFSGPKIKGTVLRGGADWQTVREDGTADLVARYSLKTDDGLIIYVENTGIRTAPRAVLDRLARGEDVPPSEYYMRTAARMEVTAGSKYDWLNRSVILSTGMRRADSVVIRFYRVL